MNNIKSKKCTRCGIEKPAEKFYKQKGGKFGLRSECKQCTKQDNDKNRDKKKQHYIDNTEEVLAKGKLYRENNKDKISKHQKDRYKENKEYIWNFKLQNPCYMCGESHPACLDFHHINVKTKFEAVADLARKNRSLEVIQREIDKCEILCANCHREKHFKDIPIGKNKKLNLIRSIKENQCCKNCSKKGIACLVFHHIEPKTKLFNIGKCSKAKYTIEMIIQEIKKCDILCENCHRKLHHKLRQKELNG